MTTAFTYDTADAKAVFFTLYAKIPKPDGGVRNL